MIFRDPILRAILRGEVNQHRRPVQAREPYYRRTSKIKSTGRSTVLVQPFNPREGDRFPVQQRVTREGNLSAETHGHVILTSACQEFAGNLTFDDARAMGYRTTSEAMEAWLCDNDPGWLAEEPACQICGGPGLTDDGFCVTCGCDDQPRARFTAKHSDRLVWVLRFELDSTHVPRLLAALPADEGALDGDYVVSPSRAMADEPEALSESDFEKHVSKRAGMSHEQWRALERSTRLETSARLSYEQRIAVAQARAAQARVDITREVWMARKLIAEGRPDHVIERRVDTLEAKAFRDAA